MFVQRVLNFLLELLSVLPYLSWAFFSHGGGHDAPHHKFVVIAPMIMKFGRDIKLDVFYTMVSKKFVTSLLLRNYDVMTCILAYSRSLNFRCS